MKRNPHPARRSRIATLAISSSAFVSVVSGLVWNTQQAELVANVTDTNTVAVEQTTSVPGTPTSAAPIAGSTTPAATIAPTAPAAPAAPAKKATTSTPSAKAVAPTTSSTTSVSPATPAAPVEPAAPAPAVVAPAVPAPVAVYTCMSPGGKTENPTASGGCQNAKYGYVLTQI